VDNEKFTVTTLKSPFHNCLDSLFKNEICLVPRRFGLYTWDGMWGRKTEKEWVRSHGKILLIYKNFQFLPPNNIHVFIEVLRVRIFHQDESQAGGIFYNTAAHTT
jgi:hypothetical protein